MEEHTNLSSKWSSMKTYIQVTWCRLTELYLGTYMYMNAATIIKKKVMYLKKKARRGIIGQFEGKKGTGEMI